MSQEKQGIPKQDPELNRKFSWDYSIEEITNDLASLEQTIRYAIFQFELKYSKTPIIEISHSGEERFNKSKVKAKLTIES